MNMSDEELLAYGKKYMESVGGFIQNNHYKLVDIKKDYCVMEAEVREESLNPYGMVHGGFMFGLADTAAGVAARSSGKKAVTLSSHIEYLHAGHGKKIKAVVEPVKVGNKVSVYEVFIYDEKEVLIAKATVDYFYMD